MNNEYDLDNVKQTKKTHQFKSLGFYLKKKQKMALYRKDLVKQLVETGYYNELYHRIQQINNKDDFEDIFNQKDVEILGLFNRIAPTEMNDLYEELFYNDKLKIKEIPLNI